ncbi:DUF1073 domain-containing protein [Bordetella sp. 02P26C-1]|uniref:DUF1073 domain-containing protein n=1 Tax=Bordetella sp. 02P26C-1 TaxID=2683195 RepID=UPI00136524C4|nr:DUF1073 domain-containing protein [Bordetella sp. 02P26C-1]
MMALALAAQSAGVDLMRKAARPKLLPGVVPESVAMAQDTALLPVYDYANTAGSGVGFIGYPELSALAQRPEYRKMSEVIAKEMTRKWIVLESTGDDDKSDKINAIEAEMRRLRLRRVFREAAELDGQFGRAQVYIEVKKSDGTLASTDPAELQAPLIRSPAKIGKGALVGFKVIEPVWTSPNDYNTDNPMSAHFYRPTSWFVLGKLVNHSRLLNFVGRQVPDLLKPAYNFGGLSLTQMALPYVENWLRTRQSVSDLIAGFSVPVLKTNLTSILGGDDGSDVFQRLELFNRMRNNRGAWAIDNDTEEFNFENVPLSGLDALQAQSQEQMASVSGIPLVKLLGITPAGLNANSDGEIRVFYDYIESLQEDVFRDNLQTCLEVIQLSLYGEIDPDISFSFAPLYQLSDLERAQVRKTDADTDAVYVGANVLSPDEVRGRLVNDPGNNYHSLEDNSDCDDEDEEDDDLLDLSDAR